MRTKKKISLLLLSLVACLAVCFSIGFAVPNFANSNSVKAESTYTTKDIAMLGSIASWHGNGNFEVRLTLGEADWTNDDAGKKSFDTTLGLGDLPTLLKNLDFFNHIVVGGKTLAEWGCTTCYDNAYWLNESEPDYTLMIPLAMGAENMATASAAGVGASSRLTILEGALIPSYGYLKGTSTTVYRAGCDFVTENSDVAYGVMSTGKTEVESVKYVQGHDGSAGYFGVSLKGDDYLGDGSQAERHPDYYSAVYTTNHFQNKITINGVAGQTESYGLFNLGSKGQGYFAFVNRVAAENMQSITIPAGTLFPSRAMKTLFDTYGNPVYIMYETQTDVTFYQTANGEWVKLDDYKADAKEELDAYRAEKVEADYFVEDVAVLNGAVATAKTAIDNAQDLATVDGAVAAAKDAIDAVAPKANVINPAKEEVENYKEGLFRTAEETQRLAIVETAKGLLDQATASAAVTEIVENAKASVDQLKTAAQYADEELAQAKTSARNEISNYLDKTNYYAEQHQAIDDAIANGHQGVADAADENAINQAVVDAKAVLDEIATKEEVVASLEADLTAYMAEENLFRAEQKAQRDSIVANAIEELATTNEYSENAEIVANAKQAIDELKTDAELTAEELAQAKADAKEELDAYKADEDLYREEEATEREEIVTAAKSDIDEATSQDDITAIVASAKQAIDELKTDAELTAEEALAEAKQTALAQINEKKASLDLANYSEENVTVINNLFADAKEEVEAATTEEEAMAAATAFETAVDAVPTLGAQTSEPATSSGCSGSVDGASAVMGVLTLCAVAFVARKRR